MKVVKGMLCILLSATSTLVLADGFDSGRTPLRIQVEKVYTVEGYDNNDFVRLMAKAVVTNSCQTVERSFVYVDKEKMEINIRVEGSLLNKAFCAQMILPVAQPIDIGYLNAGSYTVNVEQPSSSNFTKKQTDLLIVEAKTDTVDDVDYAPVDKISLNAKGEVLISGQYPYLLLGCMRIAEVNVDVQANDTMVVKPIVKYLSEEECADNIVHSHRFEVNTNTKAQKNTLVHVRRLAGTSLSEIFF